MLKESLKVSVTMSRDGYERYASDVSLVMRGVDYPVPGEGQTLDLTYQFWVEYWGGVEKRLEAFQRIVADPEVSISASVEELKVGRSVLVEMIRTIDLCATRRAREV